MGTGGLHAGGAWSDTDTNVACADNEFSGVFCDAAVTSGALPTHYSTDLDGFIGGAQAGYNFQRGMMVFGVAADISWTSIDGSASVATDAAPISVPGFGVVDFEPAVASVSQELS